MRHDIFRDKRDIHIKLDKNVHTEFRKKLFAYDLTMQDVVNEFADLFAKGDPNATKIVENFIVKKTKKDLEKIKSGETFVSQKEETKNMSESDRDVLYELIKRSSKIDNDDEELI